MSHHNNNEGITMAPIWKWPVYIIDFIIGMFRAIPTAHSHAATKAKG